MKGKLTQCIKKMAVSMVLIICCAISISTAPVTNLHQGLVTNYPNPFDSRQETTTIVYSFLGDGYVSIKIYDLFGCLVKAYPVKKNIPGVNMINWNGTNEKGQKVAKGGYLCIVEITRGAYTIIATRKIGVIH